MPTVFYFNGWRFFFFAEEGNEPMHVHAEKAERNCKFWIHEKTHSIEAVYYYKMNPRDKREVEEIILICLLTNGKYFKEERHRQTVSHH